MLLNQIQSLLKYWIRSECQLNRSNRIKDIKKALIKNMEFVMNRINNENLRVEDFEKCVHNLTGAINCLAELQLFLGRDLVYSKQPLLSVLDKRPFI